MNIFVCDTDPIQAAKYLPNKLVVKLPIESAQMLCTAIQLHGCKDAYYKMTHSKHPCTLWAAKTRANFNWLVTHGIALSEEYTHRYGRRHKCQDVILDCAGKQDFIPDGELTRFALAMPDKYKCENTVEAYRKYMIVEKTYYAKWIKREKPEWWNPSMDANDFASTRRIELL